MTVVVRPAQSAGDIAEARRLFREYEASLDVDLRYQGFEREVAELPGAYAPPRGRLLLAVDDSAPAGCVGLRPLGDEVCEMKRLYVRPAHRRRGIGRMLAQRAIASARAIGYERMVLDTLATMHEAHGLYAALGFADTVPYAFNPIHGARYLALELSGVTS